MDNGGNLPAITISRGKWDKLSDVQKDALRRIGMGPEARSDRAPTKAPTEKQISAKSVTKQKAYVLAVDTTCRLCKQTIRETFNMLPTNNKEAPYLKSEIHCGDTCPKPDRLEQRYIFACKVCPDYLMKGHTKLELANLARTLALIAGKTGVIASISAAQRAEINKISSDLATSLTGTEETKGGQSANKRLARKSKQRVKNERKSKHPLPGSAEYEAD